MGEITFLMDMIMLNSLQRERDRIAMEASLSMNLTTLLKDTFPSIVAGFSSFVGRWTSDIPAVALSSKQSEFVRELTKHAYLDIAALTAYVPEGLDATYPAYLKALTPATEHAVKAVQETLTEYSLYLSQLVTNADQKLSSASITRKMAESEAKRRTLNKELGLFFGKGSTRTERTMGDVVERLSDWTGVFQQSQVLNKLVNSVDRTALNRKVNECATLLETVMAKIERGDFAGVSSQAVNNLSDGAYSAASELEFFVATYYKVASLTEALNRTVEHFHLTMKK